MSSFRWTEAELRRALGLSLERSDLEEHEPYTGISTDSRTVEEGELYVALAGERFDGHAFVADAVAAGARGAVVSHPVAGEGNARIYPVGDTLEALGALARHRRAALAAPVVVITGSSGKTTTKDLLVGALSGAYRVHATPANLNNRIGLPQTLLDAPDDAQVVVLEAGTNEPGEIAALAGIARPDIAVVVTVSESHLEKLGSAEGVLDEKLDLLRGVAPDGRTVVGDDPPTLVEAARALDPEVRVAGWSEASDPELRPGEVEVDHWGRHRFRWQGAPVEMGIPGRHAVSDALLALTVAQLLDVPPQAAARGVASVRPRSLRGEHRRIGDLMLLVDCYNANPQSVRAALDLLEAHEAGRKVAVLGTMLELGEAERRLHQAVLRDALSRTLDLVVATGVFSDVSELAESSTEILSAPDWKKAYPGLRDRLQGDETVLLKASRGVALEGMLEWLERDFGQEHRKRPDGADEGRTDG